MSAPDMRPTPPVRPVRRALGPDGGAAAGSPVEGTVPGDGDAGVAKAAPGGRWRWPLAAAGLAGWLLLLGLALWGTGFGYYEVRAAPEPAEIEAHLGERPPREWLRLRAERRRLADALRRQVPRGAYVVIDQTHNRIRLLKGEAALLEASCSAGSGMVLKEGQGGRVWVFDTPRGAFRVLTKLRNPVWRKPDWAFVEEGLPIPKSAGDRLEYGVLGEYALYFGDGYMIHGTLYERLIGRPVSHGCIRVGRAALRELNQALPVGAPVYIY